MRFRQAYDRPVVYVTTAQPVFGAHFLQALAAVPQIRDVVAGLGARPDDEQGESVMSRGLTEQALRLYVL